jgi:hypothetical protein
MENFATSQLFKPQNRQTRIYCALPFELLMISFKRDYVKCIETRQTSVTRLQAFDNMWRCYTVRTVYSPCSIEKWQLAFKSPIKSVNFTHDWILAVDALSFERGSRRLNKVVFICFLCVADPCIIRTWICFVRTKVWFLLTRGDAALERYHYLFKRKPSTQILWASK